MYMEELVEKFMRNFDALIEKPLSRGDLRHLVTEAFEEVSQQASGEKESEMEKKIVDTALGREEY